MKKKILLLITILLIAIPYIFLQNNYVCGGTTVSLNSIIDFSAVLPANIQIVSVSDSNLLTDKQTSSNSNFANTDEAEVIEEHFIQYADGFTSESLPKDIIDLITGKSYQSNTNISLDELRYLQIKYYNLSDQSEEGELICNQLIAEDLLEIFYELYCSHYPFESIRLIDYYNADDELSMEHNNTSCFNYRLISNTNKLSKHALGMAIDINPFYNPYVVTKNEQTTVSPASAEQYADRDLAFSYKISKDDLCYKLFIEHGFTWGGNWKNSKDYQHFEK